MEQSEASQLRHALTHEAHDSRVVVAVGDVIEFTLAETPTTGYMWEPVVDERILRRVEDRSRAPEMPRGAPGERVLGFEALASGETELCLVKRRPWQDESIDEVRVNVAVASAQPPGAQAAG